MSYKYQIGCGDEMGSEAFQLEHDEQFTNAELTAMIGEAVLAVLAQERKSWKRLPRSFESIHREVILWLVANKGFTKIEYEVNWWVGIGVSIFDKTEWNDEEEDYQNDTDLYQEDINIAAIVDMVNAAGYDRTDDEYLLHGDIDRYLLHEGMPQTVEEAKQMIIDKFCTDKLTYEDIMERTLIRLAGIVDICNKHRLQE